MPQNMESYTTLSDMPEKTSVEDNNATEHSSGSSACSSAHSAWPLLDRPKEQIRLLYCIPRDESDDYEKCGELHFELHIVDRDKAPRYHAISYTWGDTKSFPRKVHVDNIPLQVTASCHYALWQTRLLFSRPIDPIVAERELIDERTHFCTIDRCFYVWVDAVCINQGDHHEKGAQVQMMGTTFESAEIVLVCIGPHASESHLYEQTLWSYQRRQDYGQQIASVANRPYWSRLWIVQEVLLARRKIILCGNSQLSWRILQVDYEHYQAKNSSRMSPDDGFEHILLGPFFKPMNLDLFAALRRYGDMKCTDVRDRVFGLLSLITPTPGCGKITVDYSLSALELALVATEHVARIHDIWPILDALEISLSDCDSSQTGMGGALTELALKSPRLSRTFMGQCFEVKEDSHGNLRCAHGSVKDYFERHWRNPLVEACKKLLQDVDQAPRPLCAGLPAHVVGYVCQGYRAGDWLMPCRGGLLVVRRDKCGDLDSFVGRGLILDHEFNVNYVRRVFNPNANYCHAGTETIGLSILDAIVLMARDDSQPHAERIEDSNFLQSLVPTLTAPESRRQAMIANLRSKPEH